MPPRLTHDPTPLWHLLDPSEVATRLASPVEGLTEEEATLRRRTLGPNEIPGRPPPPWWRILIEHFRSPILLILSAAALLTLGLGDVAESIVIALVIAIDAAIGVTQQIRARRAMDALGHLAAPLAHVLRDGGEHTIRSIELVPGDRVVLRAGGRIPADLRLVETHGLEIDESMLTGESIPVRKDAASTPPAEAIPADRTNLAFLGTSATRGSALGIVVHTGASTLLGGIALEVAGEAPVDTPLQHHVRALGRWIAWGIGALASAVLALGILRGIPVRELLTTTVALAVSAIPEGLPVVLTLTLAIGARRMAARNAIVRSLPAVETLGGTTVIGSDKTGTLTRNRMAVQLVWTGNPWRRSGDGTDRGRKGADASIRGADPSIQEEDRARIALKAAVLASDAPPVEPGEREAAGVDPMEWALLEAARDRGMDPAGLREDHPRIDLLPFDPERRLMASRNREGDGESLFVKGAPEVVIPLCSRILPLAGDPPPASGEPIPSFDPAEWTRVAGEMASDGLRVLAMALLPDPPEDRAWDPVLADRRWILAGMVGLEDPLRPRATEAVRTAREAGIRVLMLTGDHVATACSIGDQLGMRVEDAVEGYEIDALDDDALAERLAHTDVFARVAPSHKLRITRLLRERGEVVAVTGDGVNDAAALAAADLGVAMGASGTDVAREAADMVLADDDFATITSAVEEGRRVFSNVRKVTFFLLSTGSGEILTILVALAMGWPMPLLAAQILWVNLVTNGFQDVALALEPGEPGAMSRPPRSPRSGILTRPLLLRLLGVGVVLGGGTLSTFLWALDRTEDLEFARTAAMTQMVVFQFFQVLNCRSLDRSLLRIPAGSNPALHWALAGAGAVHLATLHAPPLQGLLDTRPLDPLTWGVILGTATAVVLAGEMDKLLRRRRGLALG